MFFETWLRTRHIRGTVPLGYIYLGYATAPLLPVTNFYSTMTPFKTSVWIALGISIVVMTVTIIAMSGNDKR